MHLRGFFMHDHYRYEIIFSTFASAKRKQNRIRLKKHEEYITRRTYHPLPPLEQKSLRCICQHRTVCHHRLPAQSVADSSLSKQKTAGTAGHAGCGEESTWKEKRKEGKPTPAFRWVAAAS